jgi:hypothetical protein
MNQTILEISLISISNIFSGGGYNGLWDGPGINPEPHKST